ncbi:hydroxymethylglutaryl-CoA lyase [Arenicella chitinivorans]|uniref:hydroxymethylglutaryl-CoA lyase n=1 Tax=Arenicella chitinivorans TaxID=1329800 RepID=A0A918RH27_9GAMM|nr:hydroxymethylglutaryl-CoA lyase [Arenicella chitinivorans]GGZ97533.1 hydroxymethylglutaryl-CoA lyase [Arenicella chitinivorans]
MSNSNSVTIVEVGPRDGLQNEATLISVADKVALIEQLANAGLRKIEAGSFVSPKWVPQMADSGAVFDQLKRKPGVAYTALTPNMRGFEAAVAARADEVAVFGAASEAFSQKNINCSIEESIARFEPVMAAAKAAGIPVRGYVSCVVDCPYDGAIDPQQVTRVAKQLLALGCYEISLGDTIGTGTPNTIRRMLNAVLEEVPAAQLAIHCHDTYGQAIANIHTALELGIRTVDSSVGGLGGCPYAKGAAGNVATEDVVYLTHGLGFATGVDLPKLVETSHNIAKILGKPNQSKVANAMRVG